MNSIARRPLTRPRTHYALRLARTEADVAAAQRLRYEVFVDELGGTGPMVDHVRRREIDRFDAHCDHLLLLAKTGGFETVVGTYRLMRSDAAGRAGGFYTEGEYDLTPLLRSGRRLLELGRSCVRRDHRGGTAILQLWTGLSDYIRRHHVDILFGTASFHGTDIAALAGPLSILHYRHLAPPELRTRALPAAYQRMDLLPEAQIDRADAMRATPALIKAYLRLGGVVGDGAFVDHAFNTVDVCLVMDTARLNGVQAARYAVARPILDPGPDPTGVVD